MIRSLIVTSLLTAGVAARAVDVAYAPPIGGMSISIGGGSMAAPVTTWFAMPLTDQPQASGVSQGKISSVTSTSISAAGANWAAGALSTSAYPYAIRILSGTGEGATFDVTGNTIDTVTVAGRDPAQLGVSPGDVFQLIPVDTLNSLFGANTFLGGSSASEADIVTLSSTVQVSYYFNTALGRWVRSTGPAVDRGNTAIPLGSVVAVSRKSSGMSLRITGMVPLAHMNHLVANAGSTYMHTGFPTEVSIGSLAVQSRVVSWISAASAENADLLMLNSGGTWVSYFHNGSHWQRTTGPAVDRGGVMISSGTAIQLFKRGTASGFSPFTRQLPYAL